MKEAVPGQQAGKTAAQRELAHVREESGLVRQIAPEQREHLRSGIDTGHRESAPDQFACDGKTGAAADIEQRRSGWKQATKPVEPRPLGWLVAAQLRPRQTMSPVEIDDGIVEAVCHRPATGRPTAVHLFLDRPR